MHNTIKNTKPLLARKTFAAVSSVMLAASSIVPFAAKAYAEPNEIAIEKGEQADEALPQTGLLDPINVEDYRIAYISFPNGMTVFPQFVESQQQEYIFVPSGADMSKAKITFAYETDRIEPGAEDDAYIEPNDMVAERAWQAMQVKDNTEVHLSGRLGTKTVPLSSDKTTSLDMVIGDAIGAAQPLMVSVNPGNYSQQLTYMVMQSAGVKTVFVHSEDPIEEGMDFTSYSRDNKARGDVDVYNSNAKLLLYDTPYKHLKARGNSSFWGTDKKSYQLKLEEPADLLENQEASKTWVFISLCYDPTLVRNAYTYKMAKQMNLDGTPECEFVDFYYDGLYRGTYLMCEKVEIGYGRVDIDDLDDANDNSNKWTDLDDTDAHPLKEETLEDGRILRYVDRVANPRNIKGGYLLELDNLFYNDEKSYFTVTSGDYYTLKSPENASYEEIKYISNFMQEVYDCIENGGIHPTTKKTVGEYIDMGSFVRYIYLQELAKNIDCFTTSTYFYKPADEDKLYAGPIWDMDDAYGIDARDQWFGTVDGWRTSVFTLPGNLMTTSPKFMRALSYLYSTQLKDIVESSLADGGLYDKLIAQVSASGAMNAVVWNVLDIANRGFTVYAEREQAIAIMRDWTNMRLGWLDTQIMWNDIRNPEMKRVYSMVHDATIPAWSKSRSGDVSAWEDAMPASEQQPTDNPIIEAPIDENGEAIVPPVGDDGADMKKVIEAEQNHSVPSQTQAPESMEGAHWGGDNAGNNAGDNQSDGNSTHDENGKIDALAVIGVRR